MKNQPSFYERHVKAYQNVTGLWFPARHRKLIGLISGKPHNILDISCGTGSMLGRIEHVFPGGEYFGIDVSRPMIEFAANQYPKFHFKVANAENLPFKSSGFDVATNAIAFHHYQNPEKALSEAHRVLKPGGQLLLMDITPKLNSARIINDFAARYIVRDGHEAFRSLDYVKSMFRQTGFQEIEQHFVGFPGVHVTLGYKNSS